MNKDFSRPATRDQAPFTWHVSCNTTTNPGLGSRSCIDGIDKFVLFGNKSDKRIQHLTKGERLWP